MRTSNNSETIQEWKGYILLANDRTAYNDAVKRMTEEAVSNLQRNSKDNDFISSITAQYFKASNGAGRISEKQAYWIAKIGTEKGYLN